MRCFNYFLIYLPFFLGACNTGDRVRVTLNDTPVELPDPMVCQSCDEAGQIMGSNDMEIGAGQTHILLPSRGQVIEVTTPMALDQADTEYRLMADITAPGTAFTLSESNITFNLNGHSITYGRGDTGTESCYGIFMDAYGKEGIIIANGSVIQSPNARGTGDPNGKGKNPLYITSGVEELAGLYLEYHTDDTSGIFSTYVPAEIHHNTLVDNGRGISNRHQGIPAIAVGQARGIQVHHNLIRNARHRGIDLPSQGRAFYNEIHINSHATNSYGIFLYQIQDFQVDHNKIYGRGEHPIGMGPFSEGGGPGRIFSNYVEVENTRSGREYGNSGAACLRITWGGEELEISCNSFVIHGGGEHPELLVASDWWGEGLTNPVSYGRALWLGGLAADSRVSLHHNQIQALNRLDAGYVAAVALVCNGENSSLEFRDNIIIANQYVFVLADNYGQSGEYPRFISNRLDRRDQYSSFKLIANLYPNGSYQATGHFIDNDFGHTEITPDTVDMVFGGSAKAELIFSTVTAQGEEVLYYLTDQTDRLNGASSHTPFEGGHRVYP